MKRPHRIADVVDLAAARAARRGSGEVARESLERLRCLCRRFLAEPGELTLDTTALLDELDSAAGRASTAVQHCLSASDNARRDLAQTEELIARYEARPQTQRLRDTIAYLEKEASKLQQTIDRGRRSREGGPAGRHPEHPEP